jgi:hypothetical protein
MEQPLTTTSATRAVDDMVRILTIRVAAMLSSAVVIGVGAMYLFSSLA